MGPEAVSLVERSNKQCPVLGGSTIGGSTVIPLASLLNSFALMLVGINF